MRIKVMLVFGTRPEAIKMCPLVKEMQKRDDEFEVVTCVTGQHREMLASVLDAFEVDPEYNLDIMSASQTLFDITNQVLTGMQEVIKQEKPDLILVHGDTTTSFASALSSFYMHVPIGHVEAGLRTHNLNSPWPEEFNRQAVDLVSDLYFAPTEQARKNLLDEGKDPNRIFVTGNTGIDALASTISEDYKSDVLDWADGSKLVLITAHRRENLGEPMRNMFHAIKRVLEENPEVKAVYPIHMNPAIRKLAKEVFGDAERLRIVEPLDVLDFHNLMASCAIILTDSGGVQEEAPSLGVPVLVMRDTTERPEGVEAGTLRLVGTDEETIYMEFTKLLKNASAYEKMARAVNPYGDGKASARISAIIASYFSKEGLKLAN
ncbi:MAG: UDP-N-acetylglucosamine 2-epimerase (non-hydrolyzing) [Adlercreutzia sp.]|nr:UDP-N-acetylglucosamine 2-epimerase (non-hydrolyzing) [Adlercreutzia sp.]